MAARWIALVPTVGLWTGSSALAQDLDVTGSCPGVVGARLNGATANGPVFVYGGKVGGSTVLAAGPCAGTTIDLGSPKKVASEFADAAGKSKSSLSFNVKSCGIGMQALDLITCAPSDVETAPACTDADADADGVGVCFGDCDDTDAAAFPGAIDVCGDGIDQNCSGDDASCAPVGDFEIFDGPPWMDDPPVMSCVQACAHLFGGRGDEYSCSTDPVVLDHQSFVMGWGDSTFCTQPAPEDFSKEKASNPGYNCGSVGCSYSAYVMDGNCHSVNYCWVR